VQESMQECCRNAGIFGLKTAGMLSPVLLAGEAGGGS
jgi:hypothetical protein